VLAVRVYALSHGRAMALQTMYGVAEPFLFLALVTAAWHLVHLVAERDVERAVGRLAGLHGVYLFMALLFIGATRYSGYAALLLLLLARGLGFALLYFSLDWLRPELTQAPMLTRLGRAAESAPLAVLGLVIGLASVAGMPPLAGFAAKWALYRSALVVGQEWAHVVLVLYVTEAALVLKWVVNALRQPAPRVAHCRDLPGLKRWIVIGLVTLNIGTIAGPPVLAWLLRG
jgi:NADH-quinone oxidoreductase subunit N